jgi:hypothetical protein
MSTTTDMVFGSVDDIQNIIKQHQQSHRVSVGNMYYLSFRPTKLHYTRVYFTCKFGLAMIADETTATLLLSSTCF